MNVAATWPAAMANKIGAWRDTGISDLAFAIGGADGLSDQVRQEADLMLSFECTAASLVRGMLAEQLYRSQQICRTPLSSRHRLFAG